MRTPRNGARSIGDHRGNNGDGRCEPVSNTSGARHDSRRTNAVTAAGTAARRVRRVTNQTLHASCWHPARSSSTRRMMTTRSRVSTTRRTPPARGEPRVRPVRVRRCSVWHRPNVDIRVGTLSSGGASYRRGANTRFATSIICWRRGVRSKREGTEFRGNARTRRVNFSGFSNARFSDRC